MVSLGACAAVAAGWLSEARGAESAAPNVLESIQQQVHSVLEKCQSAVARIEAWDDRGRLSGTGFFVDPNGTLYTSYSVGGETRDITVISGETRHPARRLMGDVRSGIAILKIDAETPFLAFGKSRGLEVATPVVVVGYPFDLPISPSFGMIGGFDVKYLGRYFATTHIRANVPVQRGQGGAPLLNLRGEVIGVLISSLDQGSSSFVLPIEAAEKVQKDFLRFQKVRQGWLGIEVGALGQPVHGSTASVKTVFPDSPAQKAGVVPGDVLLQIGDQKIDAPEKVIDGSFFLTADDSTKLRVARDDHEIELDALPTDHPEENPPPSDDSDLKRIAPAFFPGADLNLAHPAP